MAILVKVAKVRRQKTRQIGMSSPPLPPRHLVACASCNLKAFLHAADARQYLLAEEFHRLGFRPARQDELAGARTLEVDQRRRELVRASHQSDRGCAVRPHEAGP